MDIAIVENNQVTKLGDYKKLFPNVSFASSGPDSSFLQDNSAYPVAVWRDYDKDNQKLTPVYPYYEDGVVYTVAVIDKTDDDRAYDAEIAASSIRSTRNQLLSASDWTQVLDAPVNQEQWAAYRQALRDITLEIGFPQSVTWPETPNN
jgi:hypothetical protein